MSSEPPTSSLQNIRVVGSAEACEPGSSDSYSFRNVLNAAIVAAAPEATVNVLVFYRSVAGSTRVQFGIRQAISYIYMTSWDLLQEHEKPLVQVSVFPLKAHQTPFPWLEHPVVQRELGLKLPVQSQETLKSQVPAIFVDDFHDQGGYGDAVLRTSAVVAAAEAAGAPVFRLGSVVTEEMRSKQDILSLNDATPTPTFDHVVMGGTFDHMHSGHRQLLTMASLVSGQAGRVVVGVTSDTILKRKKASDLIEPGSVRREAVLSFLKAVNPETVVEIHEIFDAGGPSIVDPLLQAIVVSSETLRGGLWVNDKREAAGLNRLTILTVERSAAATCSSTYLRSYLAAKSSKQSP